MAANTRFAVAVHLVTLLARAGGDAVTSDVMAGSVNTNAVVIRRILGALRAEGIVAAQRGAGGGWMLARDPAAITLDEIYRCTERGPALALHRRPANPNCPVGRHIERVLASTFAEAEAALEARLALETVADVLRRVSPARSAGERASVR